LSVAGDGLAVFFHASHCWARVANDSDMGTRVGGVFEEGLDWCLRRTTQARRPQLGSVIVSVGYRGPTLAPMC